MVFCSCCFLRFFPFCIFVFCLFFWRSVFLLRVFSQVCLFFVACVFWQHPICCLFCVCTSYLGLLCFLFAFLLRCFATSLTLSLFFLLPITRTRRGECVLSTYIGHSPSCSYPKRNLKYVVDGAGGEREGGRSEGGLRLRGCVCRPFNVMKETHAHTHWGTYDIDKAAGPWRSYTFAFHYLPLLLSPSHSLYLLLSLSPCCFVSAKFRNKEKFAVAIFCILKCGLYVCVH